MNEFFTTGAIKDRRDSRDYRACGVVATQKTYPESFALVEKFGPKMQWGRGSCTNQAFAHHKERQEELPMSARFGMAMVKTFIEGNIHYGGYTRNGFKSGKENGLPEEKLYDEPSAEMDWKTYINGNQITEDVKVDALKHKIESYWRVEKNIDKVKDILLTGHSVVCSMAWYKVFNSPISDGTLPSYEGTTYVGGHAIEIVGWNDKTQLLKIKNSWSKNWGKDGYFYMPYDYFIFLIWDLWTSLDIESELPVDNFYGNAYKPVDMLRDIWITSRVLLKYKRLPTRRESNALLNYWSYEAVFEGEHGDIWLYYTFIDANIKKLLINNKNMGNDIKNDASPVDENVDETLVGGIEVPVTEEPVEEPVNEEPVNEEPVNEEPVDEEEVDEEEVAEEKPVAEPVPSFL